MLLVSEIFGPVIQGEGALCGIPTVFVRFGGCDYRCSWCDSLHAVLPENKHDWHKMTADQIVDKVNELCGHEPIVVTFSGGNPALMACGELVDKLQDHGHSVAVETQGSRCPAWFAKVDHLILSPKPPSSGMATDTKVLSQCVGLTGPDICLKVVVGDEDDFQFALSIHNLFPDVPFFVQPLNETPGGNVQLQGLIAKLDWLMDRVIAEGDFSIVVRPQLHVMVYGNERCK